MPRRMKRADPANLTVTIGMQLAMKKDLFAVLRRTHSTQKHAR